MHMHDPLYYLPASPVYVLKSSVSLSIHCNCTCVPVCTIKWIKFNRINKKQKFKLAYKREDTLHTTHTNTRVGLFKLKDAATVKWHVCVLFSSLSCVCSRSVWWCWKNSVWWCWKNSAHLLGTVNSSVRLHVPLVLLVANLQQRCPFFFARHWKISGMCAE